MSKFQHVLAAVEAREQHKGQIDGSDLFAIGDALIIDCGAPSKFNTRSGTQGAIERCSKQLVQLGYKEYRPNYLRDLRSMAYRFIRPRRHTDLTFATHHEAGDPDFLDWMIEEYGDKISKRDVRKERVKWRQIETQRRAEEKREAEEAAKRARTPAERKKAEERVAHLTDMPEPSRIGRPDKETEHTLRNLGDLLEIDRAFSQVLKQMRGCLEEIRALKEINEAYADSYVEQCKEIGKVAEQIENQLTGNKLKVIKGGKVA